STGAHRAPGVHGGSLSFDGVSGRVTVPDTSAFDVRSTVSIAAWVRSEGAGTQGIVKKSANHATNGYELSISSTGVPFFRLNQATSGDQFRINAPTPMAADGATWTHLAATFDGAQMRLYVDGVLAATDAGPSSIAANDLPLVIGDQAGGGYPF